MVVFFRGYDKSNPVFLKHLYKLAEEVGPENVVVIYDATDREPFESNYIRSYNFTIADFHNSGYPMGYDKKFIADSEKMRGAPIPWPDIYYNCEYSILLAIKELNLEFDYAWSVEWDVALNGNWKVFFEEFSADKADFLGPYLRRIENDDIPFSKKISDEAKYISFGAIHRYSRVLMELLDVELRGGLHSFYEMIIPTVAYLNGLSMRDIDLVNDRYYYYWDTMHCMHDVAYDKFITRRGDEAWHNYLFHPIVKNYV